jgi:hypothetical protein
MKTVTQPLRRKIKTLFSEVILTSLIVGFLCISFAHIMPAHADMSAMSTHASHDASLSSCCETGGSDHMELWKSTFVGIPQSSQDIFALLIISLAATFVLSDFFPLPKPSLTLIALRYRQYAREHPELLTYNPLRLAFARGILHPKTF